MDDTRVDLRPGGKKTMACASSSSFRIVAARALTGEMLLVRSTPVFVLMMVVIFVRSGPASWLFGLPVQWQIGTFAMEGACVALGGFNQRLAVPEAIGGRAG